MKKSLTLILICFIFLANAQSGMLNGTGYAPDISVSDINGNSHNLYSYLNSDKVVVLELMSTTCGHCQQYAAGTENSYQAYGPNGLDVAEFIALEVNSATSDNDLANFATTYGVSFPMCNGISPSAINYQLFYTPSYYVIYPDSSYVTFCPSYCQTTSSSSTIEGLLNTAIQSWIPPVYGCTDPLATNYDASANNDDGSCDFTSYTITTLGVTFSPDTIICDVGDTINFILGGYHNAVEVSNSTWLAGGGTSNGGFGIFGSGGQFIVTTAQTYYYVCQPHVSMGMKGVIIANALPISGCTDATATNYDPTATIDDGSCTYPCTENEVLFNMYDLWGDGWNGGSYTVTDMSGNTVATGGLLSGSFGVDTLCLPTGCYNLDVVGNPFSTYEIRFDFGDLLTYAMVGSYTNLCVGPINGCTDSTATNYDPTATIDDGSCTYTVCTDYPTGLNVFDVIDTRVNFAWDNMNTTNCLVLKYYVRYREVGASAWNTRAAGVGNGLCNFGLNTTSQMLLGLTASTTYEWKLKAFYCGGSSSNYSPVSTFTTEDACPILANLAVQTFTSNHTKANFTWDSTGTYTYARVALRVDVTGSAWQTVGGFGTFSPALSQIKFGLVAGESYRAGARAYCNANISSHRSWWTPFIFWTQPGIAIKLEGGAAINNLDIYPNPSRDIFNVSFTSEDKQDLKVRILNVIGEVIISEDLQQFIGEYTKQINLSDNAKGIYFLEIETNDGVVNKKLILQ